MTPVKVPNSRAAVKRFEMRRDSEDHRLYPEVPDDYGVVHAVLLADQERQHLPLIRFNPDSKETAFIEYAWAAPEVVCGRRVRVIFSMQFDTDEDDACPDCLRLCGLLMDDEPEYQRQIEARMERRRERAELDDWHGRNS
ncbi:hypothetical protein EV580_3158 [Mycobacterium sp. BK086]|nr:hypothetical protein EV580_3158 [Mycobacterium sp. BK086]